MALVIAVSGVPIVSRAFPIVLTNTGTKAISVDLTPGYYTTIGRPSVVVYRNTPQTIYATIVSNYDTITFSFSGGDTVLDIYLAPYTDFDYGRGSEVAILDFPPLPPASIYDFQLRYNKRFVAPGVLKIVREDLPG